MVVTDLIARYDRVLRIALPRIAAWLGSLVTLVLLFTGQVVSGALLAVAIIAVLWAAKLIFEANREHALRVGLGVGLVAASVPSLGWGSLIVSVPLLGVIFFEREIDWMLRARLLTKNLPGHRMPLPARVPQLGFQVSCAGLVVVGLGAATVFPAVIVVAGSVALLALVAAVGAYQLLRARRHTPEREVAAALAAAKPSYLLYYSGPQAGSYQIQMWLPHLRHAGGGGVIVVREQSFLPIAAALSDLPVVYAASAESLEYLLVPGLNTAFYVNNEARTADGVRFAKLRHVHLGHGDSDKPSSYAAIFAIFDQIFVAGQAGIDRFSDHGVAIPAEKFVLVGRPQLVGALEQASMPLSQTPVVLYAPTWAGALADMQLSSLPQGEAIVSALLAAGARVVFRPHPFSYRDAASRVWVRRIDELLNAHPLDHQTSDQSRQESVFASMNRSDAMVADTSSLVSDYLFSDKPFVLTLPGGARTDTPLAQAGVVLTIPDDPRTAIAALLGSDALQGERAVARAYYLGDWPVAEYEQRFTEAARQAMEPKPAG